MTLNTTKTVAMEVEEQEQEQPPIARHTDLPDIEEPSLDTQEERDQFWKELVAQRELERKLAIQNGKMDDPQVPKRLEDAITIVGTCPDMCPRFERYRRERENNLASEFETIPGTKRIDHKRAVKMYERAAGDKTLPSDLRPAPVLKKTLDYLFHDLLTAHGMEKSAAFIRDRSRAVRNDLTMQHLTDSTAMDCHDRCARFHILAIHYLNGKPGFSLALEEQQLMNTLQSLKEFYEDQRGKYASPHELEMRVYHRLIHIRDQKERAESIPARIANHPVFLYVTQFRKHVQNISAPISKTSKLVVDQTAMEIFGKMVESLRSTGDAVMIYLVALILERLFGNDTIEDIESIKGGLTLADIIDGNSSAYAGIDQEQYEEEYEEQQEDDWEQELDRELQDGFAEVEQSESVVQPQPHHTLGTTIFGPTSGSIFGPQPTKSSPFPSSISAPRLQQPTPPPQALFGPASTSAGSVFGSPFGGTAPPASTSSILGQQQSPPPSSVPAPINIPNPFGQSSGIFGKSASAPPPVPSVFGSSSGYFGSPAASSSPPKQTTSSIPNFFSSPSHTQPTVASSTTPAPPFAPGLFSQLNKSTPAASDVSPPPPQPPQVQPPKSQLAPSGSSSFSFPSMGFLNPTAPPFTPSLPFSLTTPGTTQSQPAPPPSSSAFGNLKPPLPSRSEPLDAASTSSPAPSSVTPAPVMARTRTNSSSSMTPPLKINTAVPTVPPPRPLQAQPTLLVESPRQLPAAPKHVPVSLPSTPTNTLGPQPSALLNHLKGTLGGTGISTPFRGSSSSGSVGGSGLGPLSPLVMGTPTTSGSAAFAAAALGSSSTSPFASMNSSFNLNQPPMSKANEMDLGLLGLNGKLDKGKRKEKDEDRDEDGAKEGAAESEGKKDEEKTKGDEGSTAVKKGSMGVKPEPEVKRRSEISVETLDAMKSTAAGFAKKGTVVRTMFRTWLDRVVQAAEYLEAWDRSEAYRAKNVLSRSTSENTARKGKGKERTGRAARLVVQESPMADKKRRQSSGMLSSVDSPQRKRARRRSSGVVKPARTDEELAQRFKSNHDDHERRWAVGSFLRTFQNHVKSKVQHLDEMPARWQIWVSTNPVSDPTAIWVEKKFDIPNSGSWASETVFSIPIAEQRGAQQAHPGVIVFECTPLEGEGDSLERKYRVLDDCARLRTVLEGLSGKRFYNPALLTFCWARDLESYNAQDFFEMVGQFVKDGTLKSHVAVPMNSSDFNPDQTLTSALEKLTIDVEGERVRALTTEGVYNVLSPVLKSFIAEWISSCTNGDHFNWKLFNLVVRASFELMNSVTRSICGLCNLPEEAIPLIPEFPDTVAEDSDATYDQVEDWLADFPPPTDVAHILMDIESHRTIEQDFPARIFMDHMLQLLVELISPPTDSQTSPAPSHLVLRGDLAASIVELEELLQPWRLTLSQRLNKTAARRAAALHKRRPSGGSVSGSDYSNFLLSPEPESKRLRLSTPSVVGDSSFRYSPSATPAAGLTSTPSRVVNGDRANGNGHHVGGHMSPPQNLSASVAAPDRPPVMTAAMLRAFTKDIKRKYMPRTAATSTSR